MVNVNWDNCQHSENDEYFCDLAVGDAFKIATERAQGAVYVKIEVGHGLYLQNEHGYDLDLAQLEVVTGQVFAPTESPVEQVEVDVTIHQSQPCLY